MDTLYDSDCANEDYKQWLNPSILSNIGEGSTLTGQEAFGIYVWHLRYFVYGVTDNVFKPRLEEELHPVREPSDDQPGFTANDELGVTNPEGWSSQYEHEAYCHAEHAVHQLDVNAMYNAAVSAGVASPIPPKNHHANGDAQITIPSSGDGWMYAWQARQTLNGTSTNQTSIGNALSESPPIAPPVLPPAQPATPEQGPWHPGYDSSPQRRVAVNADTTLGGTDLTQGLGLALLKCKHKVCAPQTFLTEKDLNQHNTDFEYERKHRYKCDACGNGSKNPKDLRRHKLTHKDPELPCSTCGRPFRRNDHLTRHNGICKGPGSWSPSQSTRASKRSRAGSDTGSMIGSVASSPYASFPSGPRSNVTSSPAPQMRRIASQTRPAIMRTPAYGQVQNSLALDASQVGRPRTAVGVGPGSLAPSSFASSSPLSQGPDVFSPALSPPVQATPSTMYTPRLFEETSFDFNLSVEDGTDDPSLSSPSLQRKKPRH